MPPPSEICLLAVGRLEDWEGLEVAHGGGSGEPYVRFQVDEKTVTALPIISSLRSLGRQA